MTETGNREIQSVVIFINFQARIKALSSVFISKSRPVYHLQTAINFLWGDEHNFTL